MANEHSLIIHPDDAASRGIADGDAVRVFNDRGQFTVVASVQDTVSRGVVVSPMGGWRKNAKAGATLAAVNPRRSPTWATPPPTFSDTLVEVEIA